MVNMLRMDFYRLMRSKSFWIILGCCVVLAIISVASTSYLLSSDFFESMQAALASSSSTGMQFGVSVGPSGSSNMSAEEMAQSIAQAEAMITTMSQAGFAGNVMLNGGGLATLFVVFIAIFYAGEFETGYSKNIFTAQPNRFIFFAARFVEIIVLALVFTVVSLGSTLLCVMVSGLGLAATPIVDLFAWFGLVTLGLAAFGMATVLVVWLTRKMAAGIVVGILLSAGVVGMLLQGILSLIPSIPGLINYTLYSCMKALSTGTDVLHATVGIGAAHIAITALCFLVLYA
ncbi:MAG: hypothetical protein RR619_05800, partial [Raoultibacter sp.]